MSGRLRLFDLARVAFAVFLAGGWAELPVCDPEALLPLATKSRRPSAEIQHKHFLFVIASPP
jgi:hypothetical protein